MRKIIMVKKLLANGEPCAKCLQAQEQLERRGLWGQIAEVVWAKEGEPGSAGLELARQHGVDLAPFFIVQEPGQADRVVTSTLKLIQELSAPRGEVQAGAVAESPAAAGAQRARPGTGDRSGGAGGGGRAPRERQPGGGARVGSRTLRCRAAASRSAAPKTWC